ncbi:MAG: PAS domain S-box protein [Desulfobacterales bacterium]|nr:PAS domain S-box protein [Desulfobacterales bacterium]
MEKSTIMIVEDNLLVAEDLKSKLSRMGYAVADSAKNGEQALLKAEECHPDLILMDINLGDGIDGIETAAKIREKYDPIIVYLTAYTDGETISRAKLTEPHGFIVKPFDEKDLKSTIDIATHKKRSETFLAESHRWMETLLKSIGDAVIASDAKGNVAFINPVAQQLTGWNKAEAIGRPVNEVFHIISEKSGQIEEDPVSQVLKDKVVIGLANHTLLINKNGAKTPISDSGAPIKNDDGEIIGVVLIFQDNSESRRARQEILKSNKRYNALFNDAPVPLWEEDYTEIFNSFEDLRAKGILNFRVFFDENPSQVISFFQKVKIIDVNNETLKLYDAESKEQLIGNLDNLFTENALIAFKEQLIALESGVKEFETDSEIKTLSGAIKYVHINLTLDREKNNKKIKILLSTIDVTENRKIERALQKNEEQMRLIFDNSPVGISTVDVLGNFVSTNPAYEKMVGYTKEELKGMSLFDVTHPDDRPKNRQVFQKMFTPESQGFKIEKKYIRKDGTLIQVSVNATAVIDQKGRPKFGTAFVEDISEAKRIEEQLRQSQKMESIGNLAGGIAHDFNNILTSILGFSDLALNQVEKGSVIEDDLKEIQAAGLRAKDLVKQILTFARKSEDIIKPVSVYIIAKEALKLTRSSIPATIEIIDNINSRKQVMGNPTQIHQIFMNLFTNAAHAMDEEGGILKVDMEDIKLEGSILRSGKFIRSDNYIKIEIADTGTGIPEDKIEFIYEPYFTTKDQGEGTGLGLAVVHGIVQNCGGKIIVETEFGKGTKFIVYLPYIEKVNEKEVSQNLELPKGDERVLFVDDETQIAKMGCRVLNGLGYKVDTCTSSLDALELFKADPDVYDIIISDMTMPKLTGYQLAQQMLETKPDTKFILCSGYSKKLNDESIRKLGIKAMMTKPIANKELANTIRKVLDN